MSNTGYKRSLYLRLYRKHGNFNDPTFNNNIGYIEYDGKNSFTWNGNQYLPITQFGLTQLSSVEYNQRLTDFKGYVENDLNVEYGITISINNIIHPLFEPVEYDTLLCVDMVTTTTTTLQEFFMCEISNPYFDVVNESNIGYLDVGSLVSDTHTVGDYVIDWYLDDMLEFTSGTQGSGLTGILYHPFSGTDKIPAASGTYYPKIRWVELDGELYSSTIIGGYRYSPDLLDCLSPINVDGYSCLNGNTGTTYSHTVTYDWTADPGEYAARTVTFDLNEGIDFLAWRFYGYTVQDKIEVRYVDQNNNSVLKFSGIVGNNQTTSDYNANPVIIDKSDIKHVIDLRSDGVVTGSKIRFDIFPSWGVVNPATNWVLSFKCLDTLDFEDTCDLITEGANTPINIITYDDSANCRYIISVEHQYSRIINYNKFITYFDYRATDINYDNIDMSGSGTTIINYYFQHNITSSTNGISTALCKQSFSGTVDYIKSGNVLTIDFSEQSEYNIFKTAYNNVKTQNSSIYTSDSTKIGYYYGFHMRAFDFCGDGNQTIYISWHDPANVTFDDVNYVATITFTTITNNYQPSGSCDLTNVDSFVTSINTTYNLADFSWTGCTSIYNPTQKRVSQTVNADIDATDGIYYIIFDSVYDNICDLESNGWCSIPKNKYHYVYGDAKVYIWGRYRIKFKDGVDINDPNDALNNFEVYMAFNNVTGCAIDNPNDYHLLYDMDNGTGIFYPPSFS